MLQRVHNLSSLAMPKYRPVSIAKLWELSLKRLRASLYLQLVIKSKYSVLSVLSSFAIIRMSERELVVYLMICDCKCSVALPYGAIGSLQCVIVVFPGHTHLHFC